MQYMASSGHSYGFYDVYLSNSVHWKNQMNCSSLYLTNIHPLKVIITIINCHHPFLPPPSCLLSFHLQACQHRFQMPQPHSQPSRAPTSCPSRVLYMKYFTDLICQVVCSRQLALCYVEAICARAPELVQKEKNGEVSTVN